MRVVAAALCDARRPGPDRAAAAAASTWPGAGSFPAARSARARPKQQALNRELAEELGVEHASAQFCSCGSTHDYRDRRVELSFWIVRGVQRRAARPRWPGAASGCLRRSLPRQDMLEADGPFIEALQRLYNESLIP